MQLCYQYMPGGRTNFLFTKFEKKYKRKMYSLLEQRNFNERLSDIDPNQELPDILPLNAAAATRPEDGDLSQTSPNFNENLHLRREPLEV
jgi:hypothetical protein